MKDSNTYSVTLTKRQQSALESATRFAESAGGEFLLSGLAGTGKTTTTTELIHRLNGMGMRPLIAAPTGKAAHVLNTKLLASGASSIATTIHRALAERPMDALVRVHLRLDELEAKAETGKLTEEEVEEEAELLKKLDREKRRGDNLSFMPADIEEIVDAYDIMIFDEASMIGMDSIYRPLISPVPLPRIFVGDSAQLPPVKDTQAVNFARADAHLSEILRQGKDSGILQFAHAIHSGRVLTKKEMRRYDDLRVLDDHSSKMVRGYEDHQIIVWSNKERFGINPIIRKARGFDTTGHKFEELPVPGEMLLVDSNDEGLRLLRGQTLVVSSIDAYGFTGKTNKHDVKNNNPYSARVNFIDANGRERNFRISMTDMMPDQVMDDKTDDLKNRRYADMSGVKMMWPYAITCHKSQGSEYDKVLIIGSMIPERHDDWKKWWYTAATRAKSELVLASFYFANDNS